MILKFSISRKTKSIILDSLFWMAVMIAWVGVHQGPLHYMKWKYPDLKKNITEVSLKNVFISPYFGMKGRKVGGIVIKVNSDKYYIGRLYSTEISNLLPESIGFSEMKPTYFAENINLLVINDAKNMTIIKSLQINSQVYKTDDTQINRFIKEFNPYRKYSSDGGNRPLLKLTYLIYFIVFIKLFYDFIIRKV